MTLPYWCCAGWCNPITCPEWVACLPEGLTLNLTVTRTQRTVDDNTRVMFEITETLVFTNVKMIVDPLTLDRMIPLGGAGNGTWTYHFETTTRSYPLGYNYHPGTSPPWEACPDCKEDKLCETTVRDGSDIFTGYEFYIDCHDPCNEFESPIYWINSRSRLVIDWLFHHSQTQTNYEECVAVYGPGSGYQPDNTPGLYTGVNFEVWGSAGCLSETTFDCKSFYTPFTTNMPVYSEASICSGAYCVPFVCDLTNESPPWPASFNCCDSWKLEQCNSVACLDSHVCWDSYPGGNIIKECNCVAPNYYGQGVRKGTDDGSVSISITIP